MLDPNKEYEWQIQYEWGDLSARIPPMMGKIGVRRFVGDIQAMQRAVSDIHFQTHSNNVSIFYRENTTDTFTELKRPEATYPGDTSNRPE